MTQIAFIIIFFLGAIIFIGGAALLALHLSYRREQKEDERKRKEVDRLLTDENDFYNADYPVYSK